MEFLMTFGVVFAVIAIPIASIQYSIIRMKHLDYVRDVIDGIEWLWEYDSSCEPINIKPYCEKCGTQLIWNEKDFKKDTGNPDWKIEEGVVTTFYCAGCNDSLQLVRGIRENHFYLTKLKIKKNIRDLREFRSGKSRKR